MASTRHAGSFQIFQDTPALAPTYPPTNKHRPQLQPSPMPLQPINNVAPRPEAVLTRPMSAPQQFSPLKPMALPPLPTTHFHDLKHIPIPPPPTHDILTDSPSKKLPPRPMLTYGPPVTQQPSLFTTFETYQQENIQPASTRNDNFVDFPDPSYPRRPPPLKRSFSEAIQPHTQPNAHLLKRPRMEEPQPTELLEPEDMPPVEDNGGKPTYSYATMIGMAILRAPNRRLTLSQIYDWIAKTFVYYRLETKRGWHNSIRHNLSLNKAFAKQERPKSDVGKGSYWVIVPGMEMTFMKDKPRKGNGISHMLSHAHPMQHEAPPQPLMEALAPNPWLGPTRPQPAPALPELSSDATLPASDPALEEDEPAAEASRLQIAPPSSSPDAINSSPPMVAPRRRRGGSSPVVRPQPTSGRITRKRTNTAMDDSGYFSSIESSALRPNKSGVVLTSELDLEPPRPKRGLKRGRAEEEIARIRSSSHDLTPSHHRFRSLGSEELLSSSPVRPSSVSKLNPTTPSVVFKKPLRPPVSVSPNTQLRDHRRKMSAFTNSPIKSQGMFSEVDSYSPAFNFPTPAAPNTFYDHFDVYADAPRSTPATPGLFSSPLKRSVKRSSLLRANTAANILEDVTRSNTRLNAKTPSKIPALTLKPTPLIYEPHSPGKANFDRQGEEFLDFAGFLDQNNSDEGESETEGVDILKGFQKIGGMPKVASMSPATKKMRPGLGGRSLSTRF